MGVAPQLATKTCSHTMRQKSPRVLAVAHTFRSRFCSSGVNTSILVEPRTAFSLMGIPETA
jgi:hypothetical protein